MEEATFEDLPHEIQMHIASMLDYKELSRCCLVSRDMKDVCSDNKLWKPLCLKVWNKDGEIQGSRQAFFKQMYLTSGRYMSVYKRVSDVWWRIKHQLSLINPAIVDSLKPGLTDEDLDGYEKELDLSLPVDLRCLLTFHGGQEPNFQSSKGTVPTWFFGKLKSYDYLNNFSFAGLRFAKMDKKLYAVLSGKNGGHCLLCYLGDVSSNKNKNKRNINHNLKIGNVIATNGSSYFLEAKSPLDLFCKFAEQLEEHRMPVHEGILYRFWGDPSVTCTTRGVNIRVYTSYLYELSSLHCHVFAYLVEFKMDSTANEEDACKLETRMWEVESSKGGTNRVEGDGVIGEYPVFKRGTHYTYISCTNIFDSAASMRGYYTVKNLSTNQRYRLKIPEFHMEIPQLFDL